MKEISLTRGKFALVDEEDFDRLIKYKWHCSYYGYAIRTIRNKLTKKTEVIRMHREIIQCPKDYEIDHINNNPLDNRKENLRICSRAENCRNMRKPKNNSSGYRGVSFEKRRNKYRAYITLDNKQIHLGQFNTAIEAAITYNIAAVKYHGKFANLNKIERNDDN